MAHQHTITCASCPATTTCLCRAPKGTDCDPWPPPECEECATAPKCQACGDRLEDDGACPDCRDRATDSQIAQENHHAA